jgi:hypothetical protein
MILVDFLQQANSFYLIAWSFCSFDLPRCDLLTIYFFFGDFICYNTNDPALARLFLPYEHPSIFTPHLLSVFLSSAQKTRTTTSEEK